MLVTTTVTFAQAATEKTQTKEALKTIATKVKGITCVTDLKTISASVKKLKGISTCNPGKPGTTTTFNIAYDAAVISEKDIHAAIQNTAGCKNPNDRPYKVKQ